MCSRQATTPSTLTLLVYQGYFPAYAVFASPQCYKSSKVSGGVVSGLPLWMTLSAHLPGVSRLRTGSCEIPDDSYPSMTVQNYPLQAVR